MPPKSELQPRRGAGIMALIGLSDKRCVVGRTGHSAKTKAHRGREIDILIFPFEGQAAGYSAQRRGHGGKMWSLLFPFRRLFLFTEKSSPRSPAVRLRGQPGWR